MSPPLAAIIYGAFIFYLFRRLSKEAGPMRGSLWIPFIWVTINATRSLSRWMSSGTDAAALSEDNSGGSFYDRNTYLLLMFCGVFVLSRRPVNWPMIMRNCRWLMVLFGYYLISTVWSEDTFVAFKRWIKAVGDIIMILIILAEADPVEALRAVFLRSYYLIVPLSVISIKYFRDIGRYYGKWEYETHYCGLALNKNSLGLLAMLGALFLLWHMVDMRQRQPKSGWFRHWPDLLVLGMCLWLLDKSKSSTSTVCLGVGTAIFFAARLPRFKKHLRNLGWFLVLFGAFMAMFTVSNDFRGVLAGMVGRNATLTDRTLIWDMLLKAGSNPIFGEGFESFWLTRKGNGVIEEFHVVYAHNGYLDVYLDTGLIGVLLFLGMLYVAGRNTMSHFVGGSRLGYLFLGLFWSCLLYNYTEIAFGRSNVFGLLILLIVVYGPFIAARKTVEEKLESPEPFWPPDQRPMQNAN